MSTVIYKGNRTGFPFTPIFNNEDGVPFYEWDGTTLYEGLPSGASDHAVTVIGPGTTYPIGLDRQIAFDWVWRIKTWTCVASMPGAEAHVYGVYNNGDTIYLAANADAVDAISTAGNFTKALNETHLPLNSQIRVGSSAEKDQVVNDPEPPDYYATMTASAHLYFSGAIEIDFGSKCVCVIKEGQTLYYPIIYFHDLHSSAPISINIGALINVGGLGVGPSALSDSAECQWQAGKIPDGDEAHYTDFPLDVTLPGVSFQVKGFFNNPSSGMTEQISLVLPTKLSLVLTATEFWTYAS